MHCAHGTNDGKTARDWAFPLQLEPKGLMRNFHRLLVLVGGMALSAAISPPTKAQINSNAGTVVLDARMPESVTVTVMGGTTVNFALLPNKVANPGSTTTTIRTAWALRRGRTRVNVWAWVPNGAAALTNGVGGNIPASAVRAAAAGSGSPGGALNTVASGGAGVPAFIRPAAATGVRIGQIRITPRNRASFTTTTLTWNINTTGVPQVPAATYTGTLNIQAQATP